MQFYINKLNSTKNSCFSINVQCQSYLVSYFNIGLSDNVIPSCSPSPGSLITVCLKLCSVKTYCILLSCFCYISVFTVNMPHFPLCHCSKEGQSF